MELKIGQQAPAINLPDQHSNQHKLSDYTGQWVLIYFYPKDNTPGCTKEACSLRDYFPKFENNKIKILGISADSIDSHAKFAKKYKLPFTLLADENKSVLKAYGAWDEKKMMGKTYLGTKRISFLIDKTGKIAKIYLKVKPSEHAQQVLEDLKKIQ